MIYLVWLSLFAPFVSFITLMSLGNLIKRRMTHALSCGSVLFSFLSFCLASTLFQDQGSNAIETTLFRWISIKSFEIDFILHIDSLSLLMTLIITGIGFLILVYSIGYTEHEEDLVRYFACMNFFIFSMLLLVLAGHFLVLFIGWEGVGLASYLLIGYWYTRKAAAAAATKAFIVNRIADLGLIIGILLTIYVFETGVYSELFLKVEEGMPLAPSLLTLITLLYFVGAIGKSAQLPLYIWLPDAMEGPTPVSALIHAATMVTAGVYLLIRMHPLLKLAPYTMEIIAVIGGATALFAAICALAQTDLKRVLAFSTISQLGFMFLACGIGSFFAALFHLAAHAFMKSLLFLTAGNVVHMMGTTDMEKMGGLKKQFPATHLLFLVGVLSMAGLPPFAAFFSKDLILEETRNAGFLMLYSMALIAAFLTGFYLMRAYCLTFTGEHRTETEKLKVVREAPSIMIIPCFFLSLLTLFGGGLKFIFQKMAKDSGETIPPTAWVSTDTFISLFVACSGVALSALFYTKFKAHLGENKTSIKNAFYVDNLYEKIFVVPLKILSSFIIYLAEPIFFTGSIKQIEFKTQKLGLVLQQFQSGLIRSYIVWIFIGSMLLFGFLLLH